MSEVLSERRPPARRRAEKVADFAYLVRVPGRPADCRAFTETEAGDAAAYAEESGGVIEDLPGKDA